MKSECGKHGIEMVFFHAVTNIMEESTELLFYGGHARELVEEAFHLEVGETSCQLPGVVSRKKQLITGLYGGSAAALGRRRINGKTAVETRKYAVSAACGAGDCRRQPSRDGKMYLL